MANGIPSRRWQISCDRDRLDRPRSRGATLRARSTNRSTAVSTSSDRTRHSCSSTTPESFTAGGHDPAPSPTAARIASIRSACRIEDVLAVVEHQQPDSALERRGHRLRDRLARLLGDTQHRGDRIGNRGRIAHRRQFENPYPVWEFVCQSAQRPPVPAGLADPADAGQALPSRCARSAVLISATSESRPMKLVVAGRRFPGLVSSARNWRKIRRAGPGART